jgi:hypothetical protein
VKAERPSQTPVKPVKGRLSKSDLEGIFAKETWRLGKTCHNNINTLVELIAHKVGLTNGTVQSRPPLTEQYGIFALGTWTNYYSEWSNGRGRWTEGRRMLQGVSLTPEQLCEGPITTASTPITRSNTVQSSEDSSHVPISEMASGLFSYFQHSGNDIVINALLGEHMTALVRFKLRRIVFSILIIASGLYCSEVGGNGSGMERRVQQVRWVRPTMEW